MGRLMPGKARETFECPSAELRIRGIRNAEYGMRNAEYGMWNAECGMRYGDSGQLLAVGFWIMRGPQFYGVH